PTAEILRFRLVKRLFLQRDRTRCVATSAMACALYKIGTACDRLVRIAVWIEGDVVGIGCEDLAPDCERPTHGERPGNAGRAVFLHRRHYAFLEISVKRTHIIVGQPRIGRERHRWIEAYTVRANPVAQGAFELVQAVTADAGLLIWGDVCAVDGPDRRGQRQNAGERLAATRRMTGRAITTYAHVT